MVSVTIVAYAFMWLRGVWVANQNDKNRADHFRGEAEEIMQDPQHSIRSSPGKVAGIERWVGFLRDWSMLFQLTASILLAIVALMLLNG